MDDATKKVLAMGPDEFASTLWHAWDPEHDEYMSDEDCAAKDLSVLAPEALRLLLGAEWSGTLVDGYGSELGRCPWCRGLNPDGGTESTADAWSTVVGHRGACALDALLKKAGVR